jgi:hypothetical protein
MNNPQNEVYKIVSRSFSLPTEYSSLEDFKKVLSEAICDLLNTDYQKLINILYRIDVDEKKFQKALLEGSSSLISEKISQLIIERELAKAELRKKYK